LRNVSDDHQKRISRTIQPERENGQ
jgi:hypothetical protein